MLSQYNRRMEATVYIVSLCFFEKDIIAILIGFIRSIPLCLLLL